MYRFCFLFLCLSLLRVDVVAQNKPLDHDVYQIWNRFSDWTISDDGQWVFYEYGPEKGDGTLTVEHLSNGQIHEIPRGTQATFTHDSRYAVYLIAPSEDTLRAARKAELEDQDMPKDSLAILNLQTAVQHTIAHVESYQIPEEFTGKVAYLLEPSEADSVGDGQTLHLHDVATGEEARFPNVKDYALSPNGAHLVYTYAGVDSLDTGIIRVDLSGITSDTLLSDGGEYDQITFDEVGNHLAFLSSHQGHTLDPPEYAVYHWSTDSDSVHAIATSANPALMEGWWISPHGDLSFSNDGTRLFFGTAPKPDEEPEEDDEAPVLDIWNWKDPLLQPMQLVNAEEEKERSYQAVIHLESLKIVQLADQVIPNVLIGMEGDSDIGLGWSNLPYQKQISWDSPRMYDVYLLNASSGERTQVLESIQYLPTLSPNTEYVTWWDRDQLAWMALSTEGGTPIHLTASMDYPIHNELHDWPFSPNPYGSAGWTENDAEFVFYDRTDVWAVNPREVTQRRSVTHGYGRDHHLRLRYVLLDPELEHIPDELLLEAFDMQTKASGFLRTDIRSDRIPTELIMMDKRLRRPLKAKKAEQLLLIRESFSESSDLWTSGLDFSDFRKVSDINPQQSMYTWGSAELVHWSSLDGLPLTGMLFKPEGFNPSKTYPMMVYFYEKMSDGLHQYRPPSTARSSISFSFYVSRGYVVFVPDIPYKVGYPGESALNAVVPGVTMLINQGFIDPDRVGVQGHSWGGYQIAYMITESDLFAAAEAGAPVVNMTSAYGGIRWASGMSRMFQYEQTQSRIGGSLWEYPLRYLDNSPLFQADKIKTPLLMLHNDDDGAVPWYQGIEFFVALRRLEKPVWMLNYNGEGHGLSQYPNRRDFAIRMQQFFDHYLMDSPAPVWMTEGVPAIDKGKTLGLELTEDQ